jgi:hypothetical protein
MAPSLRGIGVDHATSSAPHRIVVVVLSAKTCYSK